MHRRQNVLYANDEAHHHASPSLHAKLRRDRHRRHDHRRHDHRRRHLPTQHDTPARSPCGRNAAEAGSRQPPAKSQRDTTRQHTSAGREHFAPEPGTQEQRDSEIMPDAVEGGQALGCNEPLHVRRSLSESVEKSAAGAHLVARPRRSCCPAPQSTRLSSPRPARAPRGSPQRR